MTGTTWPTVHCVLCDKDIPIDLDRIEKKSDWYELSCPTENCQNVLRVSIAQAGRAMAAEALFASDLDDEVGIGNATAECD